MTDSELATLYAKIEELTQERNIAVEKATDLARKLTESQMEAQHYRSLWLMYADQPLHKPWWHRLFSWI